MVHEYELESFHNLLFEKIDKKLLTKPLVLPTLTICYLNERGHILDDSESLTDFLLNETHYDRKSVMRILRMYKRIKPSFPKFDFTTNVKLSLLCEFYDRQLGEGTFPMGQKLMSV